MRFTSSLITAIAITSVNAVSLAEVGDLLSKYSAASVETVKRGLSFRSGGGNCPAVWDSVIPILVTKFKDFSVSPPQCNDDARAAIREAFHDCGTWDKTQGDTGGCDGSLVLAAGEVGRPENGGLGDFTNYLIWLKGQYPPNAFSMADLIVVASSVAIVTCPGGPVVQTYVGRKDSTTAAPNGRLPDVHAPANDLFKLFQDKGFDAVELAALLGAHSTSKAFGQMNANPASDIIPFKGAQDSTPGLWDVAYYKETLNPPPNVFPFASDKKLAQHPTVGKEFQGFVDNKGKWNGKFADAMLHMTLLGVKGGKDALIDCTAKIPRQINAKRDGRGIY
ncbi:heme peroxidase [Tricladium varicosporioides]|nr:heme peroxidase [Hymenoscyphus varicosporioides]